MTDFKQARSVLGLSQVELAEKLGVHQSTISRLENGEDLDERTKLALEALLLKRDAEAKDAERDAA